MPVDPNTREAILKSLGEQYAGAYPKLLEKEYPHVLDKIAALPNAVEREKFFEALLLTQRSDRRGFSIEAFSEILALIDVYQKTGQLPEASKRDGDVWVWINDVGFDSTRHTTS